MILCVWMASFNVFNNDAGRPCRKVEAVSQHIPTNRESVARYLRQGTAVRSRPGIKSGLRRISRVLGDSITAKNCPIGESRSWKVRHVVVFRELQQIVRLSNKSLYFVPSVPEFYTERRETGNYDGIGGKESNYSSWFELNFMCRKLEFNPKAFKTRTPSPKLPKSRSVFVTARHTNLKLFTRTVRSGAATIMMALTRIHSQLVLPFCAGKIPRSVRDSIDLQSSIFKSPLMAIPGTSRETFSQCRQWATSKSTIGCSIWSATS